MTREESCIYNRVIWTKQVKCSRERHGDARTWRLENLVHLMKVAVEKEDTSQCIKTGKIVLSYSDDLIKQRPQNNFLTECYNCLAKVYEAMGDHAKVRDT